VATLLARPVAANATAAKTLRSVETRFLSIDIPHRLVKIQYLKLSAEVEKLNLCALERAE
jgi:hypothetical protein